MVFKVGPQGLGYYKDEERKRGGMEGHQERRGIKLSLSTLIPAPGEARELQKRKRRRQAGRRRRKPARKRNGCDEIGEVGSEEGAVDSQWDTTSVGSESLRADTTEGSEVDMESVATPSEGSLGEVDPTDEGSTSEDEEGWGDGDDNEEDMSEGEQEGTGKKRGWWIIDTVNANSWGGMAGLVHGRGALDFLHRTAADVVMVQETRLADEGRRGAAHRAARRAKWNLWAPAAAVTEKGYPSAGVAVAARVGFGMAATELPQRIQFDRTRIAHRHVGIMCRGGVHMFSVYLHTAQGMSEHNKELLRQVARVVRLVRGPWVIGVDWNMAPEVLAESGWINEVEGRIIATKAPTCGASKLDFFVVDRRLGQAVAYIKRLTGFGTSPHHLVRLAVKSGMRKLMVRTLVAPAKVPAVLPQGCLSEENSRGGGAGDEANSTLDQRLKDWYGAAERVWADIGGKEGEQRRKMVGRAEGPRFVWKCALGPPADSAMQSTKAARSWRKIEGWCNAIKLAFTHQNSRDCGDHPLWTTARVARRKIAAARKWRIGDEADDASLEEFLCAAKTMRWDDENQMVAMAAWARGEAVRAEGKAVRQEWVRYQSWLKSGPMGGLARQHAASKSVGQWLPSKMVKMPRHEGEGEEEASGLMPTRPCTAAIIEADGEVAVPANIQQEVDMETASWAGQWDTGGEVAALRWPHDMAALPPITVLELKEAAAQFKDGAGLGWDRIHPRALLRLPEHLLEDLCSLFRAAESVGDWTHAIGIVMIALLPKADGAGGR